MKYLMPIEKKTGKISPVELLDMFIANKGKLELYPTHQVGYDYDVKEGIVSKEMIVDYSFDTYRIYVELPDITKIKPYTDLYYDIDKEMWVYAETVEVAKAKKLQKLAAYDSSTAVNSFTINGIEMWLDKATRTSLTTLANACQKLGQEKMQLQIKEGVFVELPTEQVLQILAMIELYAGQCYIVTQQHSVAISKLETMTEIEAYDFEKGYPKKLAF